MAFRNPRRARVTDNPASSRFRSPRPRFELLERRVLLTASGDSTSSHDDLEVAYQAALVDFHGPDLVGKDGALARIGFDLALLFERDKHAVAVDVSSGFSPSYEQLAVTNGYVPIDVAATGNVDLFKQQLVGLGMADVATAGKIVEGRFPIASLDQLAALGTLNFARPTYQLNTAAGSVADQGDQSMRSDIARASFGVDGTGVTVGILSDTFNQVPYAGNVDGVQRDIQTGDLPANTTILQDYPFGGTDEGRGMGQIVHDIAPGAAIQFATAIGGQVHFANNIRALANAGSRVIVDDVFYFAEPFFQDGHVAQAIDQVVGQGVSYFSAAGNHFDLSYESVFGNSGQTGPGGGILHDFDPGAGVVTKQQLTVPVGVGAPIVLQWDQPFGSLGGAGSVSDLDIYLLGADGTTILGGSTFNNIGGDPIEIAFGFNDGSIDLDNNGIPDTTFYVEIELHSGPAPGLLKYIALSNGGVLDIVSFDTHSSTSAGHPNAAGANSVAAAPFYQTPPFTTESTALEYFSSLGGTSILFDAAGNRLSSAVDRMKVDFTAPDGANTTFFGSDTSRDADSLPNFFGTSAAAPHAAGVAALMLQAGGGDHSLSPQVVSNSLRSTATDITKHFNTGQSIVDIPNGVGYDSFSGHGLIDAAAAIQYIRGAVNVGDVSKLEGDSGFTDFVFTISVTGQVSVPIVVSYATVDGSATAPSDYVSKSGATTFLPGGPTTQFVTIQVVGDEVVETNETFFLNLSSSGARLLRSAAVGTILNDDVDLSINDISIQEGNFGTKDAVFTLSSAGTINQNISVHFATSDGTAQGGSDYIPRAGVATLNPSVSTTTIVVPIVNDKFNEATEAFFLNLSQPVNARIAKGVGTATIIDDDPLPAFYVNDAFITTNGAGVLGAVFTVALDAKSGRTVTVHYHTLDDTAIAGADYEEKTGDLIFPAGTSSVLVTVPIMTSGLYAGNERFFLEVSSPTNAVLADARGEGTLIYGDPPPMQYVVDDGDAGFATNNNGGWINVSNLISYQLDYTYHTPGTGSNWVTWTFDDLPDGTYQVFTRWSHFSNRATNAPYTVYDGAAALGTVSVNQQVAPSGDQLGDVVWQKLGNYTIDSGTLKVRLTDAANGYVTADAVRLVAGTSISQAPEIDVAGFEHSISDGDTTPQFADATEFGSVGAFYNSLTHAFSIRNTGNAALHLGSNLPVQISGVNAADFTLLSQPASTIAPGATSTFQVMFHPSAVGLCQATISIASDDASESPYDFMIQGTGISADGALAAIPQVASNPAIPTDVNADSAVTPLDVLIVFNQLLKDSTPAVTPAAVTLAAGPSATPSATLIEQRQYFVDVNGDGIVTPLDALIVINHLLHQTTVTPSAAPADEQVVTPLTVVAAAEPASPALDAVAVDLAIHQANMASEHETPSGSFVPAVATDAALTGAAADVDSLLFAPDSSTDIDGAGDESDDAGISDELLAAIGV